MDDPIQIRKFTESFFSQLGAELVWKSDVLEVNKVPEEFQAFFGKRAPYKLSFKTTLDPQVELVSRGSFLLKTMTSYLDQRGQTALIKLDFNRDYKEEIKRYLSFKNSEVQSVGKNEKYSYIIRCTFSSTLQYLNEKEHLTNSIFLKDSKIIDFNIDKYRTLPGKSSDIQEIDTKTAYLVAKDALRPLIETRVKETQALLSDKLERENDRIRKHYAHQRAELTTQIGKVKDQIAVYEKQVSPDASTLTKKQKLVDALQQYEKSDVLSKLAQEEAFFIQDEAHKHALNLHTKLINTSIIYYPKFTFTIFLKSRDTVRQVMLEYDPLEDKILNKIECETCKKELREIFICSSGHVICNNCHDSCRECSRSLCKQCTIKNCDMCAKKMCRKCAVKCSICWKDACKSHTNVNYVTGKPACLRCVSRCSSCGLYADSKHMQKNGYDSICSKCSKLEGIHKQISGL